MQNITIKQAKPTGPKSPRINNELILQTLNGTSLSIYAIGCIGNSLIITYFIKINRKKLNKMSAYYFLIVLLAFLDLIVCIASFLRSRLDTLDMRLGSQKSTFDFFQKSLPATTIYVLVIISFLRYQAITSPFKRQWSKRNYSLLCFLSFCLCSSFWLFKKLGIKLPVIYIDLVLVGIAPLAVLCFFVYKISRILKNGIPDDGDNKNTMNKKTNKGQKSNHDNNSNQIKSNKRSNNLSRANDRIRKRNIVALNTVKYLTLIYFMTIVLARIGSTTIMWKNKKQKIKNFQIYHSVIDLVYLINNVANVFVYIRFIPGFRHFLWNIVTCKCMK